MEKIKFLIVEDDPVCAIDLERVLEELGYQIVDSVDNAKRALSILKKEKVDFVMLDIHLKGRMNGLQLSEKIAQMNISVIFLTSYDDQQTYNAAKKIMPLAYIIKPAHPLTLQSIIESASIRAKNTAVRNAALQHMEEDRINAQYIFIRSQDKLVKIPILDIYIIEVDGNYSNIYVANKKYVVKLSLKKIKQKISSRIFIQIHRNYMVQIPKIEYLDSKSGEVFVNNKRLPIGTSYRNYLMKRVNTLE